MTARNNQEPKVWFITGASSGFGRALGQAVLDRGDRLVATGREPAALQELVGQAPGRALAIGLDVADAEAAQIAIQKAINRFGGVDVVFNNAGYGHVGAVEELTDEELRRQLDVNLFGVINVTRAVLPHMRRQRKGHLVQMSSLNGVEGLPGASYYSASKFGIEGFSETLAAEVAHLGIRVTIVEPAPFRTRFLNNRSVKWATPMPDYAPSVGKSRKMLHQMDGWQPGDPRRAAGAIIRAVEADKPPLRLPLGRMAVEHIRAALNSELAELDAWAAVGAAADFPDGDAPVEPAQSDEDTTQSHEDLVREAYRAFNRHEVEAAVALMDPNVDWPNVPEGGFVHGRDEVRKHWRQQFGQIDPRIEIAGIEEIDSDRVEARVRQVVRRLDGSALSDERLVHLFTIAGNRIRRLEVRPAA